MGWSISRAGACAALLVLWSFDGSARAAPAETAGHDEAHRAAHAKLVEGVALLKRSDFAAALSKFQAAYELVPSPNIFYDFGLAYTGLGRPADALLAFDRFLTEAPTAPAGARQKARANQEILRRQVATLEVTADAPGAEIVVDGRARGALPLSRPLYLDPGSHEIGARWPGGAGSVAETVVAAAGSPLSLRLQLPRADNAAAERSAPKILAAPEPAPAATNLIDRKAPAGEADGLWSPLVLSSAAAGVVFLGAGATFGLLALHEGNIVTGWSSQHSEFQPDPESRGHTYDTLAEVSLAAGVVALGAAAVLFIINSRETTGRAPVEGNGERRGVSF